MTLRMYEQHFEHQIFGLLNLTRKIKNAWYANESIADLDAMIQKLIEYQDINTFKLFKQCLGPLSPSFKSFSPIHQQKIIQFCGDINLSGSFMSTLASSALEDVDLPESQLRALSMMKPGKFHGVMNQYETYLRFHLQQLPLLEVCLAQVLAYLPSYEVAMIEKFKNDIKQSYDELFKQCHFSSIQYVLFDMHYRWNHSISDVLRRYKMPNTQQSIYDYLTKEVKLSERQPFEALTATAMFDEIKDHYQYLDGMLKARKSCEGVRNKNEVIDNLLLDLDMDVGEHATPAFISGCIEECLVQYEDSMFQRQSNGKLMVQDADITQALGLVDGHIELEKLNPALLEKLPQHIFKRLATVAKDKLEKKLARYLEMMITPQNQPKKESKKRSPSMQSNKKVRDNLMRLIMKHPMLYNAMSKQFIIRMLKFDKTLMRKFMIALNPQVLKKQKFGKPNMKKVNKAFIEKVKTDIKKMTLDKQNGFMKECIEKNTAQFLKQSGLTSSHPQYDAVKSKIFKTYQNIAQKPPRSLAKHTIMVNERMLMSTMKSELLGLRQTTSTGKQVVNRLVNLVKLHAVMRDNGISQKKIDAFKSEFKAIPSEEKQNEFLKGRIEKNTSPFLNQSHPQYDAVKSKLFKTYENITQKPPIMLAKNTRVLNLGTLMSTLLSELSGLRQANSSGKQPVNHLVNMAKHNATMRDNDTSQKKVDAFKKEFKAISTEHYSRTNNFFKTAQNHMENYHDKVKTAVKISQDKTINRSSRSQRLTKVLKSFQKEGLFTNWKISKFEKVSESSAKLNHALLKQISNRTKESVSNKKSKLIFKRF